MQVNTYMSAPRYKPTPIVITQELITLSNNILVGLCACTCARVCLSLCVFVCVCVCVDARYFVGVINEDTDAQTCCLSSLMTSSSA